MNQVPTGDISVERYSALLLTLYEIARVSDVESFQRQALELVCELLPFDGGWWGRATLHEHGHRVHCSYLHRLPKDIPQILNSTDPENLVARRTHALPGRVHWFGPEDWSAQPSTAALAVHMGVRQALCVTRIDSQTGLASFVSLTRWSAVPVFNYAERTTLELLAPHLAAALDLCCGTQMLRRHRGDGSAMLTTDAEGWLHVTEQGITALLQREWPGWVGPTLPSPLIESIALAQESFRGRHICAEFQWVGEHVLVSLRPRQARDALTPKERLVADAFAAGHSYKEVAQVLDLAPATVRHHLREVYLKLGVSDKAALARVLGT